MARQELIYQERLLLERVATGDQDAFARIFDAYRPRLYTAVLRLSGGDEEIAEDIVQDAFLKVWLKRGELLSVENFGGWLYVMAERMVISLFQTGKRRDRLLTDFRYIQGERGQFLDPNEGVRSKEYEDLLQTAVSRLAEKQRMTYELIKVQGLSRKEAADVLGVSPDTVKENLQQAVRKIRAFCTANMGLGKIISLFFINFLFAYPQMVDLFV